MKFLGISAWSKWVPWRLGGSVVLLAACYGILLNEIQLVTLKVHLNIVECMRLGMQIHSLQTMGEVDRVIPSTHSVTYFAVGRGSPEEIAIWRMNRGQPYQVKDEFFISRQAILVDLVRKVSKKNLMLAILDRRGRATFVPIQVNVTNQVYPEWQFLSDGFAITNLPRNFQHAKHWRLMLANELIAEYKTK